MQDKESPVTWSTTGWILSTAIISILLFSSAAYSQIDLILMKNNGGDYLLYGYKFPVAGDWTYWDAAARNPSPLARDYWIIPSDNNMVTMARVDADGIGERELAVVKIDGEYDENLYLYNEPAEGDWNYWDVGARNPSALARDFWMIPSGNNTALIADGGETIAMMKATEGDYTLGLYNIPSTGDWSYWDALARNPSPMARDYWIIPGGNDAWSMCGMDTTGDGSNDSLLVVRNTWLDYNLYLWNMPVAGDWTYWDAIARNPSERARDFWSIPRRGAIAAVGEGAAESLAVIENYGGDHNLYIWNEPVPGDWTYWDAVSRNPSARARDLWMIPSSNNTLPVPMIRGATDPNFSVDVYDPSKVWDGTTMFANTHVDGRPRIVEVNLLGEVIWEYVPPEDLRQYTNPGMDGELLENGNILLVFPRRGLYEIDRDGTFLWSYLDEKISHDADRLPNGNTIYVYGDNDQVDDAQVKEVTPEGTLAWSWCAKNELYTPPYSTIYEQGWTHANAVTRLPDGNTLVSLRNFYLTVEVDPDGYIVWSYDWSVFGSDVDPHEPEILEGDKLLIALQDDSPYQVVEIDRNTGGVTWAYYLSGLRTTRDADRLPNGNTLIQGVMEGKQETTIIEVTPAGEIVWQLLLKGVPAIRSPGWFYKAQRIGTQ